MGPGRCGRHHRGCRPRRRCRRAVVHHHPDRPPWPTAPAHGSSRPPASAPRRWSPQTTTRPAWCRSHRRGVHRCSLIGSSPTAIPRGVGVVLSCSICSAGRRGPRSARRQLSLVALRRVGRTRQTQGLCSCLATVVERRAWLNRRGIWIVRIGDVVAQAHHAHVADRPLVLSVDRDIDLEVPALVAFTDVSRRPVVSRSATVASALIMIGLFRA